MCLVVIAFGVHAGYPLIVAGNRDEFHARPTQEAHWWPDKTGVLGGRDVEAGGTWLALHRRGRFATVTNYRGAKIEAGDKESRGRLVTGFLDSKLGALDYLHTVEADRYAGFNLLVSDGRELAYMSNRGSPPTMLEPGIYGLSNAVLDTPWSKVERSKALLRLALEKQSLDEAALFDLLGDRNKGPAEEIETGHLPFAKAHALSAPFVILPEYGTRCSSIVVRDADDNWRFIERRFRPDGNASGETRQTFRAQE